MEQGKRGYRDSLTMMDISKAFREERGKDNEFPFEFQDEDVIEREASEIYSFYEIAEIGLGQTAFEKFLSEDFGVEKWMDCSMDMRKQFVISLLDVLETHSSPDTTEKTLRALQYVSQGVIAECANGVGDVRMARLNNVLLKQCCCFPTLVQGLCRASKRATIQHITTKKGNVKPDSAVSLYLNILYNMVLFNQNDATFASEIESTRFEGSPFVVILLDLITEFNEQADSPLPAKKLLMVLWKAVAATLGNMSTLKRQKTELLNKMGVPVPVSSPFFTTKSRMEDFDSLKRDAERHQHNVVFTRVFEMPDAKFLTIKRTKPDTSATTGVMESPPNSPRMGSLSLESLRGLPKAAGAAPKIEASWEPKPDKFLAQTLRLPPALGEAFRIMEKTLYIPPATLQHPEFQHTIDAFRTNPKNPAPPPLHATLPRILRHPDSQSAFERLYRQILPNLANHLVFILKIMLAAAPTVKNYAGTINLNLEGPVQEGTRHREIVLKACTSLLLLLLKHARFNNLQQFAHIRSIMIDAKAVLLMLKLVNHDLNTHISSPTDPPEMCIFPPPPDIEVKQTDLPGSYRNFSSMGAVLRILQKLTKKNGVALRILHQYKAPAILKKTLETHHRSVRLYTLKILKSLVPYLPRKWRAMNMKIISEIYGYVRLDTRDDWLSGDPDLGAKDAIETAQIDEFLRTQYIEWWHYIKEGTKDRLVYSLDDPLGMDPVQALLSRVELDEEWKANWETWVAWEERGESAAKENLYLSNKHHT